MSPHLTIYQPQLTSLLSVTHRTTGIILASYAMFLGLGKTQYMCLFSIIDYVMHSLIKIGIMYTYIIDNAKIT